MIAPLRSLNDAPLRRLTFGSRLLPLSNLRDKFLPSEVLGDNIVVDALMRIEDILGVLQDLLSSQSSLNHLNLTKRRKRTNETVLM